MSGVRIERSPSMISLDERTLAEELDVSKVLVIYTGGTIGMQRDKYKGLVPVKNKFKETIRNDPFMHDKGFAESCNFIRENPQYLVLPYVEHMKRVVYEIQEYGELLDSCNIAMTDWIRIANDIQVNYQAFDGFVILHGTDTLAYTASALSFMLENLGKTVIITGSQISLFYPVSDGKDNFTSSLILAGNYSIPEVTVFFNHKLFRGNRTTKRSSNNFSAFDSCNLPPIATVGTDFQVDERLIIRPTVIAKFNVHSQLNQNVSLIRLFPSISRSVVRAFLKPPVFGVVIQSYGAGNMPTVRSDIFEELEEASKRGIILVNCTQCPFGSVVDVYETGKMFTKVGVISGRDMTPEAALTKLAYVLSKSEWDLDMKKMMMATSLRGEMTCEVPSLNEQQSLAEAINRSLNLIDRTELEGTKSKIFNSLVSHAIHQRNLAQLKLLVNNGADLNAANCELRSPLHVASSIGDFTIVNFMLQHGASVHMKDMYGHTPLLDAIRHEHEEIVTLLMSNGAHLQVSNLGEYLCRAACSGQLKKLRLFHVAGADLNTTNRHSRTPLHEATVQNRREVIMYLLKNGAKLDSVDNMNFTPLDIARRLKHPELIFLLENSLHTS